MAAVATLGDTSVTLVVIKEVKIIMAKGGRAFNAINLFPNH